MTQASSLRCRGGGVGGGGTFNASASTWRCATCGRWRWPGTSVDRRGHHRVSSLKTPRLHRPDRRRGSLFWRPRGRSLRRPRRQQTAILPAAPRFEVPTPAVPQIARRSGLQVICAQMNTASLPSHPHSGALPTLPTSSGIVMKPYQVMTLRQGVDAGRRRPPRTVAWHVPGDIDPSTVRHWRPPLALPVSLDKGGEMRVLICSVSRACQRGIVWPPLPLV